LTVDFDPLAFMVISVTVFRS